MALQRQSLDINFSQGDDTKTDPLQLRPGRFTSLVNIVYNKIGRLTKRNGFGYLTNLPSSASFITTFNGNPTAIGSSLQALSAGSSSWVNKGALQPCQVSTLPLIRNSINQTQSDVAFASNGLMCIAYTETTGAATTIKYAIADSTTGQNVVAPQALPVSSGTPTGSPRVFVLGGYFIIVFTNVITATSHLQYIAISISSPTMVGANTDIASSYVSATTVSWDAFVVNNNLYVAWNTTTGGQAIKVTYLTSTLTLVSAVTFAGSIATMMSVTADTSNSGSPIIYVSFYDLGSTTGYTLAVDQNLNTVLAPTQIIPTGTVLNITSVATNGVCTFFYEVSNTYTYDGSIHTNLIRSNTISVAGTVGTSAVLLRSVGLASKAALVGSTIYLLASYSSAYQSSYFLINSSGKVVSRIAYENGGGYLTKGLPSLSLFGTTLQTSYLFKDLIQAVNKNTDVASGTQVNGIYSQTGINLVNFDLTTTNMTTTEIGSNLNMSGGFLWAYDGYVPVENNFFLYPENVESSSQPTTGGSLTAQIYFYQVCYEWSDNQGNLFRSAPSIPLKVDIGSSMTSTNSIVLKIPTLRLTYKTANPVKIVVYRWSTAQQIYYQTTSISTPVLNDTTSDFVTFTDINSDATILGNNIIYTNGGVVEDIGISAVKSTFIFDDRLFAIMGEDQNSLSFSKTVIQATPVEMSDLLTIYIAPSIGAQGPAGVLNCGIQMDDKAVLFRTAGILYFNGTGPDNTGANSQYSQPLAITSSVGCSNPSSLVIQPNGVMFEFASEAGNQIWLLGRDLSTKYIGAAVEDLTLNATVLSSVSIPGTNQVRFTLSSGVTLMYDHYIDQWASFNVSAISSTLYQGLHTIINSLGAVYQETPGLYLDGADPVLISFTTGWISAAGVQGYQRAYMAQLLGTYISPHKLTVGIGYNYNPSILQQATVSPTNFSAAWGVGTNWGSESKWGGASQVEQWQINFQYQQCESVQLTVNEQYDPSFGVPAGAGLTLSGLKLVIGSKKGYTKNIPATNRTG